MIVLKFCNTRCSANNLRKFFKRRWSEIYLLHLKTLVNDISFLLHVKMLENDAKYSRLRKPPKLWNFLLSQSQRFVCVWPHSLLLVMLRCLRCQQYMRIVESAREMIWALNSQTNGRKWNRYNNTFRASCDPVPPKRRFWRNYGRLAHKLTRLQVNSPTPKLTRLQVRG